MKGSGRNISLTSYDDLFSTEETRQADAREQVLQIPLSELHPFKDHPFRVVDDDRMIETVESVKAYGVLVPAIARPLEDGGYEIVAGHRRKRACELAGLYTMPVIVRDLDDDESVIIMVDSNLQRENILPSERAKAYQMKLEAIKHQGERRDLTCAQVGHKSVNKKSVEILANQLGESKNQVKRFIRLTYLVEPLQKMVDGRHENEIKMAFNPAVELSYLTESEQYDLANAIVENQRTPSLAQCQEFKRLSHDGELTTEFIDDTLSEEKPNQREKLSFQMKEIDQYFPKDFTPGKKKDLMIRLLENWAKKRAREQER